MNPAVLIMIGIGLLGGAYLFLNAKGFLMSQGETVLGALWPILVDVVGRVGEGSKGYGTLNPNDVGRGVSWGFLQFNQGAGSLGQVLARWRKIDPSGFDAWVGSVAGADSLLATLNSKSDATRLSLPMGTGTWATKLRAAGNIAAAKQAQLDIAWNTYFKNLVALAQNAGLGDAVGLAVVFDRSINQGPGATKSALAKFSKLNSTLTGEARARQFGAVASTLAPKTAGAIVARVERIINGMRSIVA